MVITIGIATNMTTSAATLNGSLTSLGSASSVATSFEYGLTTVCGSSIGGTPSSLTSPGVFTTNLAGLSANTLYHLRAKGDRGSAGISYGSDQTFTTSGGGALTRCEYYNATEQGTSLGYYASQTFTPQLAHTVTSLKLDLYNNGAGGTVTVSIRATNASGEPTGPDLAVSPGLSETSMPAAYALTTFNLGSGTSLAAGSRYAIVISSTASGLFSMMDTSGTYSPGSYLFHPSI